MRMRDPGPSGPMVMASMAFLDELAAYGDRLSVLSRDETAIRDTRLSCGGGHYARRLPRKHSCLLQRTGGTTGRGRETVRHLATPLAARRTVELR